jgi:Flp pilus assembly protein TadG
MTNGTSRRKLRQSGSTILEFAFAILPLFALLFMVMDVAWIVIGWACVQEGAREGVRYATTGSGQPESTLDNGIKAVVQHYAFGFAQTNSVAVHYYPPSGYSSIGAPAALDGTAGATAAGNIVTVVLPGVSLKSFGPIFRSVSTINISASASDVLQ